MTTPDVKSMMLSTKLEMTDIDPDATTAMTFAIIRSKLAPNVILANYESLRISKGEYQIYNIYILL